MRRLLLILSIMTLFWGCQKKVLEGTSKFRNKEKSFRLSSEQAEKIYIEEFSNNFTQSLELLNADYLKVIYIQDGFYFIGYAPNNSMLGRENPHLDSLAKIDGNTGAYFVVD